jgi:hypothetical protein
MSLIRPKVNIYIISWPGYHQQALLIAKSLLHHSSTIKIIYSDPERVDPWNSTAPCPIIRRSHHLFFSDKFKACIDDAGFNSVLVIHADAKCNDWSYLLRKFNQMALSSIKWGVWAPNISGTPFELAVSRLAKVPDSDYVIGAVTDAIVFALHSSVVSRVREIDLSRNLYGWGIDVLFCAVSRVLNLMILIDESVRVFHSQGSGYPKDLARSQANEFLKLFSVEELIEAKLLLGYTQFNRLLLNRRL